MNININVNVANQNRYATLNMIYMRKRCKGATVFIQYLLNSHDKIEIRH